MFELKKTLSRNTPADKNAVANYEATSRGWLGDDGLSN